MRTISRRSGIDAPRQPVKSLAWLRWLLPLGPLAAAFVLQTLASRNPQLVERYYSRRIFPPIIHLLSLVNGVVGFSIAEVLTYVLAAAIVGTVIYQAREVYLRRRRIGGVIRIDLLALIWISGSGILIFLLIWGLNYQREPLGAKLGFTGRSATDEQLKVISETIVNEVNSNYSGSHFDDAGDPSRSAPLSRAELYELIESGFRNELLLGESVNGRYGPPKPLYASGLLSRLGLAGFYMPFTGEPHFNNAQPDFDLPYVIAHEKAHQRGFAFEDEANFIAFLICVNSTHPYIRYSGYLNALKLVGAGATSDPEFYQRLSERIGKGPRNDLRARSDFWARHQGPARAVAARVNNSYLKANGIAAGTRSYSEDVALIIGYYLMRAKADHN